MTANPARTAILIEIEKTIAEQITEYAKLDGRARIDLIRDALSEYLDKRQRMTIAERYSEGYRRHPQPEHDPWSDQLTREMIEEEPW